jgi:hypothetical protein
MYVLVIICNSDLTDFKFQKRAANLQLYWEVVRCKHDALKWKFSWLRVTRVSPSEIGNPVTPYIYAFYHSQGKQQQQQTMAAQELFNMNGPSELSAWGPCPHLTPLDSASNFWLLTSNK